MKIRRNILLFKINCFFADLWPLSALAIVYFEQITGSYALALCVFSLANIVQSLAEIPTGILSDKIGRKYTLSASALIFTGSFIAFAYAGNINSWELLVLGGFLWGIAEAFNSGTDDALIYETVEQLRKESKYDIVYSQSKTFAQLGLATGALIAAFVTYYYSLHALAWVSVFSGLGQLVVTLLLVEPEVKRQEEANTLAHFLAALKNIRNNKKLQILALIQMLNSGTGYAAHRLEGVYFNMLIPMWMVNLTRIIKQLTGAFSFHIMQYLRNFGFFKILVLSSLGNVVVRAVGIILDNVATPFIMSCVNLFYGTESTAQSALLQKELSKHQRATMGSIISLLGGISSAIIYYLVGTIADVFSIYVAMIILVSCKAGFGYAYYRMLKKYS